MWRNTPGTKIVAGPWPAFLMACVIGMAVGAADGALPTSVSSTQSGRIYGFPAFFSRTTGATLRLRGGGGDEEPITYPSFVMEKGDFNHVIRIFNTNLPGGRTVLHSLIGIKGVGRRFGHAVIKRAGIDGSKRMGVLTAEEIEKLVQVIERPLDYDIPAWMLNRRKDYTTGKDMHLNTNKWDLQVKLDIERLVKMRAHRGLRHAWGYKVRGQRTKTTGRGIGKLLAAAKAKPAQKKGAKKK